MIKINRFLIVGGDLRNVELVKLLKEDGKEVYTCGIDENGNLEKMPEDIDIVVGPIPFSRDEKTVNSTYIEKGILIEDLLKKIKGKILIAGNISSDVIKKAEKYNIKVIDIMKSEKLAILNTIATAEGAIELIIKNTNTIIFDSNILILGYGRVARTLAQRLKGLSKYVTCASIKSEELAWIEVMGYEKIDLNNLNKSRVLLKSLANYDVIINTIPCMILDAEKLQYIRSDTSLIDLASNPGGIDKIFAKNHNLKLIHALGLPGKVAPLSSAKFIKEEIYETIKE